MSGNTQLRSMLIICILAITTMLLSAVRPLSADTDDFTLTTQVSPPGSGTVGVTPDPPYSNNQVVTLTATPAAGYLFDKWILADGDTQWWDAGWDYRVAVTAAAAGYARTNKPAEFNLNFTQIWTSLGVTGTLDPNSIRVVEVDADDNVIDDSLPFQFDKATDFNAATKAAGTLVLIMEGNTAAGASRRYHVYFDVTGKGFAPPNVPAQVVLTEQADETIAAFKIQTATGTLFIHKTGGGVSSYDDLNGNDWVSWNSATGANGQHRGIPNAGGGSNEGLFHPGKGKMTATILNQGPVKVTLHFLGKKVAGDTERWEGTFEIYPNYTTFTMIQTRASAALEYPFWFLYEGTPGGQLNPTTDFVVRSSGQQNTAGQSWNGDLPNEEWAFVADPNVGAAGRSIFLANHTDDTKNDTYSADTSKVMTILGFGRDGATTLLESNTTPRELTFGLMDKTTFADAKPIIYNAYRNLNVSVGAAEARAGASLGSQNPVQFTITGEHTIIASFKPAQYTVTVGVSPAATGTVTKTPNKATYNHGEEVTLAAAPTAAGYFFAGWQGDVTGATNPVTVPVTQNMVVTALFAQAFTVTATADPAEGGTVTVDPAKSGYQPGETITVTAVPNSGYSFTGWSGDLSSTNPTEIVTVNSNLNIVANFSQGQYTFSATSAGNGTVDWAPKKALYAPDEIVTVTATPAAGYAFVNWTGAVTSNDNPLQLPITGNMTVVGNFALIQNYTVTVTIPGGGGSVAKSPDQPTYPTGTVVTLTATPDAGKRFAGWSGGVTGTDPVIQVTVNSNLNITATFEDDVHPLNVTIAPPEGGTVGRSPNQTGYVAGTVVMLTATANPGWTFTGWSGAATGITNPVTVTVPVGGTAVTASFDPPPAVNLTTSTAGNGTGTIQANPTGSTHPFGTVVTLRAVPADGSVFAGWLVNNAPSNKNPLALTMDSDKNVIANFIVPSGPYSDNFNACSLDPKWQPINPLGDGTIGSTGTQLRIAVPTGASHNVWTDGNNAPRVMQAADDVDFEYIVKFDSAVTQTAQMQGVIIEESAAKYARFDFEFNDGLKAYAATIEGAAARRRISVSILNPADAVYMRITRVGLKWFMAYSGNGVDWTEAGSFNNYLLDVTKAGVFAGNVAIKGNPAPAHTALVDYFHNTAQGPMPEDAPLLDITIVGGGAVTTNPPLDQLACGQTVTLTADPDPGWAFGGWSGDATGTQLTSTLQLSGPKAVTATFTSVGPSTHTLLLPMIIHQQ